MLGFCRHIMTSLLLLAGIIVSSSAAAQTWTDVVAPDLRFKIEMPAPVDRGTVNEKESSYIGPRTVYQAALNAQNFDFDHIDYRADFAGLQNSKDMVLDLGRGAVEKAFPKDKFKYVRDEAVVLEGWDGYALDVESEKGDGVMMRTYVVKNRLYRLLVSYAADEASKSAAKRFIDSFKVADTH